MIDLCYHVNMNNSRTCHSDDCERHHCPKCHGHTLGWIDTFQQCSSCELEEEHAKFMREAIEIRNAQWHREMDEELGFTPETPFENDDNYPEYYDN